jgi:hypothetical protein
MFSSIWTRVNLFDGQLAASPRRFQAPLSSNFTSRAAPSSHSSKLVSRQPLSSLFFSKLPGQTSLHLTRLSRSAPLCSDSDLMQLDIHSKISLRRLAGRSSAFSPQSNCAKVFHVALHNIDCMDAFAWKTAFLPLNCFLSMFVRQFHFTSRHAPPTFITLFKAHFPTTAARSCFFFNSLVEPACT